ncbi:MAG: hypothetical protein ACYTGV_07175 [Planctomycetota bacterium]|jgi:hypothetical protein
MPYRYAALVLLSTALFAEDTRVSLRYEVEVLYCMHHRLTEEAYGRIESLFHRTWPDLDLSRLEPTRKSMREYFGIYLNRLLEQAGTSWKKIQAEVLEGRPLDGKGRQECFSRGFDLLKQQVERELRVRGIFWYLRDQAAKDPSKSLSVLFAKMKEEDDSGVCSTTPGEGLIVYRRIPDSLNYRELTNLEDDGVKFTVDFAIRVAQLARSVPPRLSQKADVLGTAGQGRVVCRLTGVSYERHPGLMREVRAVLQVMFPKGLDTEMSDPASGEFWTQWKVEPSVWYRQTRRSRARVRIQGIDTDSPNFDVRVFAQINDNIDAPHDVENARWVKASRDSTMEARLRITLERRSRGK